MSGYYDHNEKGCKNESCSIHGKPGSFCGTFILVAVIVLGIFLLFWR